MEVPDERFLLSEQPDGFLEAAHQQHRFKERPSKFEPALCCVHDDPLTF
jgi:hypothetical protein